MSSLMRVLLLLTLAFPTRLPLASDEQPAAADLNTRLDSLISARVASDSFSGVVVLAKAGTPIYERAAGIANRERQIADAKAVALERAREGYHPLTPRTAIPVGGDNLQAALKLGVHLAWRAGRISDHDAVVGRALANVLAGGSLPNQTTVSEQYLLDLEREAFLKLCGERKTLERIQHTLKTGKPLRN